MTVRQRLEAWEAERMHPLAALSARTKGRERPITKDELRTEFQRDRDRILHSKAFRRLKHKTQCFLSPEGDHFRTRLTHTLEVQQIARTIARAVRLNEDLAEAIALGHDLGHTPFGHMGERTLDRLSSAIGGFAHNEQSLRVVTLLEGPGGLNLTHEVREGIVCHTGGKQADTLEGRVVALSDRIAYINHDIDDGLRAGVIAAADLPKAPLELLGGTHGERINRMVLDAVAAFEQTGTIGLSAPVQQATDELRSFLFQAIYYAERAMREERKANRMLELLYQHFLRGESALPADVTPFLDQSPRERVVCDYIAGMTDRFAVNLFERIFVPLSERSL